VHSFPGRYGVAMIFPLGRPATWRIIAMSTRARRTHSAERTRESAPMTAPLELDELQAAVDDATAGTVRLRDPAWMSHFRLHHRQAAHYRAGRAFLAGDAAHIHSPVGAQGMNTGMQDAWNLGWKLALVARGSADASLLDTYEAERWPVGRALLNFTDRIFGLFTRVMSSNALIAWTRREVMGRLVPRISRGEWLRRLAFRFVSELDISYRNSPAVREGTPALEAGPRAGDRMPDGDVVLNGRATTLQREVVGPRMHLLLCAHAGEWTGGDTALARIAARCESTVAVRRLARVAGPDVLIDPTGATLTRLGVRERAIYLVRPDGYVAYRCGGGDLAGVEEQLARWLRDAVGHERH